MSYTDIKEVINTGKVTTYVGIDSRLNVSVGYGSTCEEANADTAELQQWLDSSPPAVAADENKPFTKEQKHALADRMIALWSAYKLAAN